MPARRMLVCTPNQNGHTATMGAAAKGHAECVELLIAAGADVNKANKVSERVRGRGDCMRDRSWRDACMSESLHGWASE